MCGDLNKVGGEGAHVTSHDHSLRIRADDVDNLTRRIASVAGQAPQAQCFAKDHR